MLNKHFRTDSQNTNNRLQKYYLLYYLIFVHYVKFHLTKSNLVILTLPIVLTHLFV